MAVLLWKEFREKGLWMIPFIVSVVGVVAFGQPYSYIGDLLTLMSGWVLPSLLVSLLFGMGAYSVELASNTTDFLYSRPVSWKRVLLSKLIVGLGMIAVAAIIGAIVYRLTCPVPYARLATVAALSLGVGKAVLMLFPAFIAGMACSVVLPGTVGSVLVFIGISVASGITVPVVGGFTEYLHNVRKLPMNPEYVVIFLPLAWLLAATVAALILVRFGLTLPTRDRIKRFVALTVPLSVVLGGVWLAIGLRTQLLPPSRSVQIGPGGRYALVVVHGVFADGHSTDSSRFHYYLVRLADGRTAPISRGLINMPRWAGDILYYQSYVDLSPIRVAPGTPANEAPAPGYEQVVIVRMKPDGTLAEERIDLRRRNQSEFRYILSPSPDGRWTVIYNRYENNNPTLQFLDVVRGEILDTTVTDVIRPSRSANVRWISWWQSNTEFGYVNSKGERHVVKVK